MTNPATPRPSATPASGHPEPVCTPFAWFEHAPGFVAFLRGPDFVVAYANPACKHLFGGEGLVGLPLSQAVPELADQGLLALCRKLVARGTLHTARRRSLDLRAATGVVQRRFVDVTFTLVPDPQGQDPAGLLVQGCEVTAQVLSRRELEYRMTHDALTDLPNYASFRERLKRAVQRAGLAEGSLQVIALDLDLFKRINAWLGHEAGDSILRAVAQRIKHAAGPTATVAHENGDKFLLLLEDEADQDEVRPMQAVAAALAEPFACADRAIYFTCCVGVATFPLHGREADSLLLAADRALARAKAAGPGKLRRSHSPTDDSELERLRLGFDLREALAAGALGVHYQPQVDLVTGKISTVEALVRWNRAGEEVPAGLLIGVAEECGLIGDLDDWMLRTACAQAARWHEMGYSSLRVAVNLAARQFSMRSLKSSVTRALDDAGLPAQFLSLELAENVLMNDMDGAVECLLALKQCGVRLCLDDFGTGYSSLARLQRLPIDVLKIDRSFLRKVPDADEAAAIVDAIIAVGHSLGMQVVAEGVEREEQCEHLARHMCDEVQGYFISVPLPAEVMSGVLRDGIKLAPHLLRFNRAQPTLLLVDDETSIVSSLKRLLRNDGYRILTANSGTEGLNVLAEHAVDVIVSDQRMPGMTGVEFLRTVRQLYPDTVRIVLSGFTELQTVTDAVNAGAIYKFLTKPWDDAQLRAHIQEAFSYGAMANENRLLTLQVSTANQQLAAVNRQLESVLAQQRREIERGAISLDVVHEALSNVPVPVLASDDMGTVVLVNRAATALFVEHGAVLGCDLRQLFPGLPDMLSGGSAFSFEHCVKDCAYPVNVRPMGNDSQSRGWIITVTGTQMHV